MSVAATFLGGARSRLLPASIPFRFFGAAVVFHLLGWAVLLGAAADARSFIGGLGWPLVGLHLITLGVLTMTAMGAALQLLPVATRRSLGAVWPTRAVFWIYLPGLLALVHGMGLGTASTLAAGAGAVAVALVGFAAILAANLKGTKDLPVVAAFSWLAVASLLGVVAVGLALVANLALAPVIDHAALARVHVIVASYGFMGMLAIGFSHVLIPLFTLSSAPDRSLAQLEFRVALAALVIAIAGAGSGARILVVAGALLGLLAVGLHLVLMRQVLVQRLRRRLGTWFILIAVGWAMLPASIVIGILDMFDLAGPNGATLFGAVVVFGWLLTFLAGVLQRIMPFLASMHASRGTGKPPLVSDLTPEGPLKWHAWLHLAALALIFAGIAADNDALVRFGLSLGLLGAIAFALFAYLVMRRMAGPLDLTSDGDK